VKMEEEEERPHSTSMKHFDNIVANHATVNVLLSNSAGDSSHHAELRMLQKATLENKLLDSTVSNSIAAFRTHILNDLQTLRNDAAAFASNKPKETRQQQAEREQKEGEQMVKDMRDRLEMGELREKELKEEKRSLLKEKEKKKKKKYAN